MSLKLLKRELEKELDDLEQKKAKTDDKKVKKKKGKAVKKDGFVFNDFDYSKEEDFTDECLRNIGLMDSNVHVKSDKIIQHNQKLKRQAKPEVAEDSASGSVFTDEDFDIISKLHFVNSKKAVFVED